MALLKFLKEYWFLAPILGGVAYTFAFLPQRVSAAEKKVEQVESRQTTIEKYIDAIEQQKELQKKAPPGWRWDEIQQKYVPDPTRKGN